jgi:methionyl-tRNA formyltransferase
MGASIKVLFFGRAQCASSQKALSHLQSLGCDVTYVESAGRGEEMPAEALSWNGEYILCFRSLFILKKDMLAKASIAAINFHPAPPEYPGSGCINFALYDEVQQYGVTAHIMNEKVDNGAILAVERFSVKPEDTVETLLERTHHVMESLFLSFTQNLISLGRDFLHAQQQNSANEKWNGAARRMKDLDALQSIPVQSDITAQELTRIIRATHTENFPTRLVLHGYSFTLSDCKKTSDS